MAFAKAGDAGRHELTFSDAMLPAEEAAKTNSARGCGAGWEFWMRMVGEAIMDISYGLVLRDIICSLAWHAQ